MSGHSPIDSLRRLAPVSNTDAAALFGTAGREELLEAVTGLPFGRGAEPRGAAPRRRGSCSLSPRSPSWRSRPQRRGSCSATAPARETTSVECVIKGVDTIIPSTSGDPAQDCTAEWKHEFGKAPSLVAYDNTLGGVTVLPRTAKPPAGWRTLKSQDVALIQLQNSLDDYVGGLNSGCFDDKAATALTKQKLAEFGLTGWSVTLAKGG